MRLTRLRRLISVLLCVSLCVLTTVTSFCSTNDSSAEAIRNNELAKLQGFVYDDTQSGLFEYTLPENGELGYVRGTIQKEILSNGEIHLDINEGTKNDEVLLKANGDVYLDNKLVTVETIDISSNENAQAPRANTQSVSKNPPAGTTASDFSVYVETIEKSDLRFGKTFGSLTIAAFLIAIGTIFGTAGIVLSGAASLYQPVLDGYAKKRPNESACSVINYKYQHKNGPVINKATVTKHSQNWYEETNFKTYLCTTTAYHSLGW